MQQAEDSAQDLVQNAPPTSLKGVEALLFDVFGTVVDWHGSVTRELQRRGDKLVPGETVDWAAFAHEWRRGYLVMTRHVAGGGAGPTSVDVMLREILESLFNSSSWSHAGRFFSKEERDDLNAIWHRLDGWPDSTEGLYALKKKYIIATLSNGNIRLLVDMARYADLPWDVVLSGELFSSYKPNPKVYLGSAQLLSVPPSKCAMVAAHIYDLQAAAATGMKTVYVRRLTEDEDGVRKAVKSRADGGEVDVVVDSFLELAGVLGDESGR